MTLRAFPTTDATAALLSTGPKAGTNRVLVTHHFVIENHVPGITPGDIEESEAAVVRPAGEGKVKLIGKIKLADWKALGGDVASAPVTHDAGAANASYLQHVLLPTSNDPVVLPDTPAGKLLAGYLAAFNSGSADTMRTFIESSLMVLPERPTSVRLESYAKLYAEHGALTPRAMQSATDEKVSLLASSKRGNLILTVTASSQQQGRAESVTFGLLQGGAGH
jgi:hypothetical protein